MPDSKQDIKTFVNHSGTWSHDGPFSVELTPDANKLIAPPGARIEGDTLHFRSGRVSQSVGGIQFFSSGKHFYWGYKFLKVIRDGAGNLLWVNDNYR